jgi:hypothetical protein
MPYHNSSYRTFCDTSDNVCLRDQKAVTSCLMHTCSMTLSVYVSSHERVVCLICAMVFNATFNNISVISWLSVLLVEETYYLFSLAISDMLTLIFGKFFYILYKLYLMVIHLHLLNQIQIFLLILEYSETG